MSAYVIVEASVRDKESSDRFRMHRNRFGCIGNEAQTFSSTSQIRC
jgi:hypothetical protein